jgi:hypothetical protein
VLQHNEVVLLELHLLLEGCAKGIEGVATGDDLLIREDADPAQTADDALLLGILELCL